MVSIVVPTYNERENIPRLLDELDRVLGGRGISYEVVVVDDDSPDGTWRAAEEYARRRGLPVRVVRRVGERGLGSAIARGLREARGRYIVVMDADLQHPPEAVPRLLEEALRSGADLVVASRYTRGGGVEGWSRLRLLISRVACFLAHLLLPESRATSDPMSGFFLVSRRLAGRVPERPRSWKVLLDLLVAAEGRVSEVPYVFRRRAAGESKLGLREMAGYVLHLLRLSGYRPLRFAAVGASGTLVNLGVLGLLHGRLGLPLPPSLLAAYEASLTWNYVLHDSWTFRGQRPPGRLSWLRHWVRYHAAAAAGMASYLAVGEALARLGVHYLLAAFLGILAGFAANFTISSLRVWTGPRRAEA
ncbi:hypothetical protein CF15_01790 [Pyrodictium occultum]|uniref:Dolichol monophosphate mannose synthase n=1 Tax=Pyrodictium occultum TaxID=2309 RepID=A0A0V8RX87_PYROC|nr:hypothetical protein CF15_01790 [Pyrodictium occultum]